MRRLFGFAGVLVMLGTLCVSSAAASDHQGSARIINGAQVNASKYNARWRSIVALYERDAGATPNNSAFCGGTLIKPWLVVTAAHCVEGESPSSIRVFAGHRDLRSGGSRYDVRKILVHAAFDDVELFNDIALIVLSRNASQPTMKLPTQQGNDPFGEDEAVPDDDPSDGAGPWAAGWGDRDPASGSEDFPSILEEVAIPILDREDDCLDQANGGYPVGVFITTMMLCGGVLGGGVLARDTCQGDSGGPLIWRQGATFRLVGLVSWGPAVCGEDNLGVYTRVSNYVNWINSRVVTKPYSPNAPTLAARSFSTLKLKWSAPPGPSTKSYEIWVFRNHKWKKVRTTAKRTAVFTGLKSGAKYWVRLRAKGAGGFTQFSRSKAFKTKRDRTRPRPVRSITLSQIRPFSVRASWGKATDNDKVAKYIIQTRKAGSRKWKRKGRRAANKRRRATIVGLASNSGYDLRIVAVDRSGNRSRVAVVKSFRTP